MNIIDEITEHFKAFPGIGPRQAKRFTYFLLRKNPAFVNELASLLPKLKDSVVICNECFRYISRENANGNVCSICQGERNPKELMILARDVDFEAVEKSGNYSGYYFILGGQLPILEKEPSRFIRIQELKKMIEKRKTDGLEEVILAMNANPEGDNTADYIKKELESFELKVSVLGRGLSTGTELEYSDSDTILHALENRK